MATHQSIPCAGVFWPVVGAQPVAGKPMICTVARAEAPFSAGLIGRPLPIPLRVAMLVIGPPALWPALVVTTRVTVA